LPINTKFLTITTATNGRLIVNGVDWFAKAFGAAIDDVRKRVVEEPWFGRAVTPPLRPDRTASDELGWTKGGEINPHQPQTPDQGHDFER
jgi:hypothetical protein